jgi:hypothetical protein
MIKDDIIDNCIRVISYSYHLSHGLNVRRLIVMELSINLHD